MTSAAAAKGGPRDAQDFIVVRLAEPIPTGSDLRRVAKQFGFRELLRLLQEKPQIDTSRLVTSVTPRRLLGLEQRARQSDFKPLHSLTSYWLLDCGPIRAQIPALVKRLNALHEVDLAYRALNVGQPTTVVNPDLNPKYAQQGYLSNGKPVGINAVQGWLQSDGTGIGFADIETAWCVGHEDLFPATGAAQGCTLSSGVTVIGDNDPVCFFGAGNHGTAVLGIVLAKNNGKGCLGVAPGAGPVRLVSSFEKDGIGPCTGKDFNVVNAMASALVGMARGDVLLIEVQRKNPVAPNVFQWVPMECDAGVFEAIRLATALGMIVVEAAGNGGIDATSGIEVSTGGLDLASLAAFAGSAPDSGAILVGASQGAVSPTVANTQDRLPASNFGARVNCYGWGAGVATAGHKDDSLLPLAQVKWYRCDFGGTSAGAAIIAGAALVVQGAFAQLPPAGQRLTPASMRALLSNPDFGTPCSLSSQNIGSMPDLQLVLQQIGSLPDLFIRDNVGDNGSIPTGGAISISPDVVVSPTSVSPAAAFAAAGTSVTPGQDNFVYVRVSNRNAQPASPGAAQVRVYWSEPATLITPQSWNPVNNVPATVSVGPMGSLVPATTITWHAADLPPAPGHYCFIASVSHSKDPEPLTAPFGPAAFTWASFMDFIRLNNNVTWRNFDVIELPMPGDGQGATPLPFIVAGAPDASRIFDLVITLDRPSAVQVAWEIPLTLLEALGDAPFEKVDIDERKKRATVFLPARKSISLPKVRLRKSARHACRFLLQAAPGVQARPATLAIKQLHERTEVGRITWELRRSG